MTTLVMLAPGARLWNVDGLTATVTGVDRHGLTVLVGGERTPVRIDLPGWALAMSCEYCDRPAEVQLRDGQPGDVLCKTCAHGQFERPAVWVRAIPRAAVKALFGQCEQLG